MKQDTDQVTGSQVQGDVYMQSVYHAVSECIVSWSAFSHLVSLG